MRMSDLLKKVKVIILVLWFLIIPITSKSICGEEYRAKYWRYSGMGGGTIGYPGIRAECLHLSYGVGASSKFRPGIGIGTSFFDIYSFYGLERKWRGLLPVYIRFFFPLTSIEKVRNMHIHQSVFHLFASGSQWGQEIEDEIGFGNLRWFTIGGGIDFIYSFLGLEGGYLYIDDYNYRKSSFYAGARLSVCFWLAEGVEQVSTRIKPPPELPKPTQVVAEKSTETEKKITTPEYPSAPDFSLLSLEEGIKLFLSELLGKRTVLYFWTPLSPEIKADMIELQKLYSKYRNDGLRVIAILAFPEDSAEALAFVDSAKISFINLIGDRKTAIKYGMADVAPGIVIIDENKKIIATEKSNLTDELLKIIVPSRSVSPPYPYPIPPPSPKPETVYLSDLRPSKVEYCELENDFFRGRPITLGGITYKKGLHTHAPAKVSYNLDGRYKRFESYIGLWDSGNPNRGVPGDFAGTRGSVIFQVWIDGVKKYDSGILYWNDKKHISISVENANKLDLIVEVDGDGNRWDWSVWGDARLIK